ELVNLHIETMPNFTNVLRSNPNLRTPIKTIICQFTNIKWIGDYSFANLDVEVINLQYNKIEFVSDLAFAKTTASTLEIYLFTNNLKQISFNSYVKLKSLALDENFLSLIDNLMFRNLTQLNSLSINSNKIANIETDAFKDLVMLENL